MASSPRTPPAPQPDVLTIPSIGAKGLLAHPDAVVVDLRAPAEYEQDHVPGAVNIPLFDDEERALVGMLYHRSSPERAFRQGLEVVTGKVCKLVEALVEAADGNSPIPDPREAVTALARGGLEGMQHRLKMVPRTVLPKRPLVLHCWRGGLRSKSVAALARHLGLGDATVLEGGYRAYRAEVRDQLEAWQAPRAFVLRGLTGVGKTLVLRELERIRPGWTLDLEGAAGHRSSLLGMVGLEPVSQKSFESRLAKRLRSGFCGPIVYEGESRKVGDAIVPPRIWESLRGGVSIELTANVQYRTRVLMDDYLARESDRADLRRQLATVQERMRPRCPLVRLFDARQDEEVVALLLEHYYDPLYRHSESQHEYAITLDSSNPAEAALRVASWIEERTGGDPARA